jgi:hypothetical protein
MYGAGPLALRIDHVDHAHPVRYEGETWLRVEGMQVNTGGADIGRRSALVRARRLPPALQHRNVGPSGSGSPRSNQKTNQRTNQKT